MPRTNSRLETARAAYREALEAARGNPSPEAWARLLAAGKDLSAAAEPRKSGGRRARRGAAVVEERTLESPESPEEPELDATLE